MGGVAVAGVVVVTTVAEVVLVTKIAVLVAIPSVAVVADRAVVAASGTALDTTSI